MESMVFTPGQPLANFWIAFERGLRKGKNLK